MLLPPVEVMMGEGEHSSYRFQFNERCAYLKGASNRRRCYDDFHQLSGFGKVIFYHKNNLGDIEYFFDLGEDDDETNTNQLKAEVACNEGIKFQNEQSKIVCELIKDVRERVDISLKAKVVDSSIKKLEELLDSASDTFRSSIDETLKRKRQRGYDVAADATEVLLRKEQEAKLKTKAKIHAKHKSKQDAPLEEE